MPLDAEHWPAVCSLQRLRRPVVGTPHDSKPRRRAVDGLVMMARGWHTGTQRGANPAVRIERDGPRAEDPAAFGVGQNPFYLRQMLDQIAAERDVEYLEPAADTKHRHTGLDRRADKRNLGVVAVGPKRPGGRVGVCVVRGRVDICAAAY